MRFPAITGSSAARLALAALAALATACASAPRQRLVLVPTLERAGRGHERRDAARRDRERARHRPGLELARALGEAAALDAHGHGAGGARASASWSPRPRSATTCWSRRRSSAARSARSRASRLVDHEGPLALVEVDDPAFWEGLAPLPFAKRLPTEGAVTIHRWQPGLLDSYAGSVRQVRAGRHGLSQTTLLTLDVASGTDGLGESEVVVSDGQVAGLRHWPFRRHLRSARRARARAVPRGRRARRTGGGSPAPASAWQDLTNPALRASLGLRPGESGVRLTHVAPNGSAAGVLEAGDVLLELGWLRARCDRPLRAPALRPDALRPALQRRAQAGRDASRRRCCATASGWS